MAAMDLPPLDLPTLFVVTAVAIMFSGLMLVIAGAEDRTSRPLRYWGTAMVGGAAGIILLSLIPIVGAAAYYLGNYTILSATALSWTGSRIFAGRDPNVVMISLGPLGWLSASSLEGGRDVTITASLASLIGAAYVAACAMELWQTTDDRLGARSAAVGALLVHAVIYVARASYPFIPAAARWHPLDDFIVVLLFEALLHTIGMAFLFLILMKERAEHRVTAELTRLALLDGLTGLGNRRLFDQALDREFRRAVRAGSPLALLLIDADLFKEYNDAYGHQRGDDCLRAIATAIRPVAQAATDVAARYGGEEFAVLLVGRSASDVTIAAEAIRSNVTAIDMVHDRSPHGVVSVSIGVATVEQQRPSSFRSADLVRSADKALYAAKAMGRNRVCVGR
jgi:diguanylate cyclase (GGDEF)-like protein